MSQLILPPGSPYFQAQQHFFSDAFTTIYSIFNAGGSLNITRTSTVLTYEGKRFFEWTPTHFSAPQWGITVPLDAPTLTHLDYIVSMFKKSRP